MIDSTLIAIWAIIASVIEALYKAFLAVPWAIIVGVLLIAIWRSRQLRIFLGKLAASLSITKISFGSTELELTKSDKALLQHTLDEAQSIVSSYRTKTDNQVAKLVQRTGLKGAFDALCKDIFVANFQKSFGVNALRATLHVQDFIFREELYQIVDYYPLGGGAFRRFSLRVGVIGRVWRSGLSASAGYLTHRLAPYQSPDEEVLISDICRDWGLTLEEALKFRKKPSYCCVPVTLDGRKLGVFYMDCEKEDFGYHSSDANDVKVKIDQLQAHCERALGASMIPKKLLEIEEAMSEFSTRRSIYAD